jgi:hypothetical protein
VLGRTAPAASLPLLAGLIAERRTALLQYPASGVMEREAPVTHALPSVLPPGVQGSCAWEHQRYKMPPAHPGGDPSVALEQLWWLVRMAGALLADAGIGETPLPPVPIAAAAAAAATADADPVARLSHELLGVLALAIDPAAHSAISPRCWLKEA